VTIEQLEELERLADGATQGSWMVNPNFINSVCTEEDTFHTVASTHKDGPKQVNNDATYIAAADPPTVKTLIRALRRMANQNSELYMEKVADENFWPHKGDIAKKSNELLQQALQEAEK